MPRRIYNRSEMTRRQALALGVMALDDIAGQNSDVAEWAEAAALLRLLLQETRPEVPGPAGWFVSAGGRQRSCSRRNGKA